jgi:nucleotide-binding universal stress UspA family protein
MPHRIIVPLDRSSFGEAALPLAAELAKSADSALDLVLVHSLVTVLAPFELPVSAEVDTTVREEEQAYLEAKAAALRATYGVRASAVMLEEPPIADSVASYARASQADLVVLSSHGRGGASRVFLGSVADRLLRILHCPILLVFPGRGPTTLDPAKPRRILIPLDGSPMGEAAIDQALALGPLGRGRLDLVHVLRPPIHTLPSERQVFHRYLDAVAEKLSAQGLQVHREVLIDESPAAAILAYAERHGCDLIALTTAGLGWVERGLIGSVADKVVRGATTPVLVWNPPPGTRSCVLDAAGAKWETRLVAAPPAAGVGPAAGSSLGG